MNWELYSWWASVGSFVVSLLALGYTIIISNRVEKVNKTLNSNYLEIKNIVNQVNNNISASSTEFRTIISEIRNTNNQPNSVDQSNSKAGGDIVGRDKKTGKE